MRFQYENTSPAYENFSNCNWDFFFHLVNKTKGEYFPKKTQKITCKKTRDLN